MSIEARRERVRRLVAKRPSVSVELRHEPSVAARDRLVDLLLELLDAQGRSGRGS